MDILDPGFDDEDSRESKSSKRSHRVIRCVRERVGDHKLIRSKGQTSLERNGKECEERATDQTGSPRSNLW